MELRICHLYPDLLNLYGDRGNLMALVHRAQWRGIDVDVDESRLGASPAPGAHDLYFMGGGGAPPRVQGAPDRDVRQRGPRPDGAGGGGAGSPGRGGGRP